MKTEPIGTHELYWRNVGFRGADGARLDRSIDDQGLDFHDFPSSHKDILRLQQCNFLKAEEFALPAQRAIGAQRVIILPLADFVIFFKIVDFQSRRHMVN